MKNVNDKYCEYCKTEFSYLDQNYYEKYVTHIEMHVKHLSKERDSLKEILLNIGSNIQVK